MSLLDRKFVSENIIDFLIDKTEKGNLFEINGSMLALSYILLAYSCKLDEVLEINIEE